MGKLTKPGPNDRVRDVVLDRLDQFELGRFTRDLTVPEDLDAEGRRRTTEYTAGIIRNIRRLDFLIDYWARRSSSIESTVRQVLRIGAYELVILERPPHVAVDASVEQAKRKIRGRKSAAFVNAILRQIARSLESLPRPSTGNRANDLGITFSHPTWMVERWLDRLGDHQTEELLVWNNTRPAFTLRVNDLRTSVEDVQAALDLLDVDWRRSEYLPDYLVIDRLQPVVASGMIRDGLLGIQDVSAGLVVEVLDPQPGEFIVDGCAAPGGKTIRAATLMQNEGRILAVDPNEGRLSMAADAASRHGISTVEFDPRSFLDLQVPDDSRPDRILLDVPCSGLGVLARRADARWRKKPGDIEQLVGIQDELLDKAARMLKQGGSLVYATCTIEPEENEERVAAFLKRHPEFEAVSANGLVPKSVLNPQGYLRTHPQIHGIDGVFAARMQKK